MNICMVTRSLSDHRIGGMEEHTELLCRGLVKAGNKVDIITTRHPDNLVFDQKNGIDIHYLKNTDSGKYSKNWWEESRKKFVQLHNKINFDLVHSQSIGAHGIVKVLTKDCVPIFTTSHGTPLTDFKTAKKNPVAVYSILKYMPHHHEIYRNSKRVIAVSNALKEHLIKFFLLQKSAVVTVLNGIDTDEYSPKIKKIDIRSIHEIDDETKIILSVGKLNFEKGVQNIISVLPKIRTNFKKTILIIVGIGSYQPTLKKLVKDLKLDDHVIFTNEVSANDLPSYYSNSDIFVFPTLRKEGLPYVLLEAMSSELPVIASRMGGISDVIDHKKNGLLFPSEDMGALLKNIAMVLKDIDLRKSIAKNARKKIEEQFSQDKMVNETIDVYRSSNLVTI